MKPTGDIVVTERRDWRGGVERYEYRWEGGDIVEVDDLFDPISPIGEWSWSPGDRFAVGPFRLRVLERSDWSARILAIRERGFVTDLRYLWHRCCRLLDIAYRRLILTLAVWRLAEGREGEIISWRNIHALRWLAERERATKERRMKEAAARINEGLAEEHGTVSFWVERT